LLNAYDVSSIIHHYKVIGFDLDDTLYEHLTFELPIFKLISSNAAAEFCFDEHAYCTKLQELFDAKNTLYLFDKALNPELKIDKKRWEDYVQSYILPTYRNYSCNNLTPFSWVKEILSHLKLSHKTVLITNGTEKSQNAKIDTLQLRDLFDLILISDSYQPVRRKPDLTMFHHALTHFNISPDEMLYIGDNEINDAACEKIGINFLLNSKFNCLLHQKEKP
jgi:putative hydrolase of the HAD superfamily